MNLLFEVLLAIEHADLKSVRRLLEKHPHLFHFEVSHGWPVLHRCLAKHCIDLDLAKSYIAAGGDVNRKANSGVSLAFLAATMADGQKILQFLTSCGGQMSSFERAVIALTMELDENRVKRTIIELLEREPGLAQQAGDNGFTLLHHAVPFHYPIAALLLERGADPNALTFSGRSPLGLCGEPSDEAGMSCYELLVARGARYTSVEQLIKMIRDDEDEQVIKQIEADAKLVNAWYPSPFGPLLHVAAWLGKGVTLVDYILMRRVDPNTPNEQGETALHRVMHRTTVRRTSSLDLIRLLVRHGANINQPDGSGYTPLHEAARHPWEEPVKALIEMGAAINAKTNDGETVLDIVHSMRFLGQKSLVHWLKAKGACSGKPRIKTKGI
jgi:ankyrin repeat protein